MWTSYGGDAGHEHPTAEQLAEWNRRTSPPDNELPAGLGATALLARTGDTAVGLTHIEVFSTGFRFTLAIRLRRPRPDLSSSGLLMLVGSHVRPGLELPLENRVLLGIEYPDGRRASNLENPRLEGPGTVLDSDQVILVPSGGGGSDRSVDHEFWVAPLPPDGPVTVVLAWPALGIEESRTVLDGAAVLAAAARSQVLWPPQPLDARPPEPPPVSRPSSGWFAQPPD